MSVGSLISTGGRRFCIRIMERSIGGEHEHKHFKGF